MWPARGAVSDKMIVPSMLGHPTTAVQTSKQQHQSHRGLEAGTVKHARSPDAWTVLCGWPVRRSRIVRPYPNICTVGDRSRPAGMRAGAVPSRPSIPPSSYMRCRISCSHCYHCCPPCLVVALTRSCVACLFPLPCLFPPIALHLNRCAGLI